LLGYAILETMTEGRNNAELSGPLLSIFL